MDPQELAKKIGAGLLSFPVTHFTPTGAFNEQSYRSHLSWLLSYNPAGLFAAGGTGEYFSLTLDEFSAIIKAAVAETAAKVPRPRRFADTAPPWPSSSLRPPKPPEPTASSSSRPISSTPTPKASSPTSKPSAPPPRSASSSTTETTPSSKTPPSPACATPAPTSSASKTA